VLTVVALLLAGCGAGAGDASGPGDELLGSFRVERVVDGDTVVLADREGTRVRLIGIDTPEVVSPERPAECWGEEASQAAERLLEGERVEVRLDPSQGRYDDYGRTLAYLELPQVGDVGLTLVRAGHAEEYTFDEAYLLHDAYRRAEAEAQDDRRGLWGGCRGPSSRG